MDLNEVLKMYNDKGMNLVEIGTELNVSKSAVSKFLSKEGYFFNKSLKKYILKNSNNFNMETVNTGNNKNANNVSCETINTVKCTFDLPVQLHRKMKSKCALNGVKMVDFVREVLEKAIN